MFIPEVESLRVQSLWHLKKTLLSREEPDIILSIVNSKARFYTQAFILRLYTRIKPNRGSVLNARSNDFYIGILNV